ncbi:MAG: hypothetical protein WBM04_15035 [Candidatus Korobacteraceae bacterium]
MSRRRRQKRQQDPTGLAFAISALWGCAVIVAIEDVFYSDLPFWNTSHIHPVSIFVGTLAFLGLLYLLQSMTDRKRALQYLEPYMPLLGFSGVNLGLKLNAGWMLPVALGCALYSVAQVRRLRGHKSVAPRVSAFK